MRFRPCIDLHQGVVKQIVGSTLRDSGDDLPLTNFVAERPPAYFADMYRRDGLEGGHVIMLGPGNDAAASSALAAYPGGLQIGGGIQPRNAAEWLGKGAAKVIVTSYVFREGQVCWNRLAEMVDAVGPERLVLDLSCRRRGDDYFVVTDRWQRFTNVAVSPATLDRLSGLCSEFLVHAVDVEGKQQGVEPELLRCLGEWAPCPTTYAGGVRSRDDVARVIELGGGRLDVTVGSALDIFGGSGLRYADMAALDRAWRVASPEG